MSPASAPLPRSKQVEKPPLSYEKGYSMSLFIIDPEKCKRDGICAAECPAMIIQLRDKESFPEPVENAEEYCINCGHCVAVCPHGAFFHKTMGPEACPDVRKELVPSGEEIDHFLRSRRSIRKFKDEPLDRETLLRLIDTARYAPSAHNLQPVRWLVIEGKERMKYFADLVVEWMRFMIKNAPEFAGPMHFDRAVAMYESGVDRILRGAPHLVVAYGDASLSASQSACIIALTYLELAAYGLGLGACWAGYFNAAANFYSPMQEALALPKGHLSFGAMMLGHAKYQYHRIPVRSKPPVEWQ